MTIVRAALAAVEAGRLVQQALGAADVVAALRRAAAVDVLASGKAAVPMLSALVAVAPARLRRVVGIAPETARDRPPGVRWHTAAHPVPDERSVEAARDALASAGSAGAHDLLVVLLSGGASSMMALPADGLTLAQKRETSMRLLALGAEIHDLNAVRKHLSAVKGGRLAAANRGATLTLAISDVVGDELSAIGSGPTVPDATTFGDALAALDRYGGRDAYPPEVVERLARGAEGAFPETPKPGDERLARSTARVIGGARHAIVGARDAAESLGYTVHLIGRPVTGEARLAAHALVAEALAAVAHGQTARTCILSAGETTVRTRGSGKGGRNQECALAMVRGIDALGPRVAAACIGTDGIDGPTDAAGALVDSATLARAEAADIGPPERYLDEHNSYVFFDELGDLIRTGPTGTNVGDVQVILVERLESAPVD